KMPYFSWGAIRTEWAPLLLRRIYFLIDLIYFPKMRTAIYIIESKSLIS
ncbi:MAG: hypothetical protein ACI90V_009911, partial [Bacillariaceae sp.]